LSIAVFGWRQTSDARTREHENLRIRIPVVNPSRLYRSLACIGTRLRELEMIPYMVHTGLRLKGEPILCSTRHLIRAVLYVFGRPLIENPKCKRADLTPKLYTPAPWPVSLDCPTLELVPVGPVFPLVLRLQLDDGQAPCTPEDSMQLITWRCRHAPSAGTGDGRQAGLGDQLVAGGLGGAERVWHAACDVLCSMRHAACG
jgi:hypothetical protein